MVILRCVLPQWDLRFSSYKCLKKNISHYILTHTKVNCTLAHAKCQVLKPVCGESEAEEEEMCCITVDYDLSSHSAVVSERIMKAKDL